MVPALVLDPDWSRACKRCIADSFVRNRQYVLQWVRGRLATGFVHRAAVRRRPACWQSPTIPRTTGEMAPCTTQTGDGTLPYVDRGEMRQKSHRAMPGSSFAGNGELGRLEYADRDALESRRCGDVDDSSGRSGFCDCLGRAVLSSVATSVSTSLIGTSSCRRQAATQPRRCRFCGRTWRDAARAVRRLRISSRSCARGADAALVLRGSETVGIAGRSRCD